MSFDVLALGNALVDVEFATPMETLDETGLAQGSMSLTDSEGQARLLDYLEYQHLVPHKKTGGGSAANSISALTGLGADAFYLCRVGDDDNGRFYLEDLATRNIVTDKARASATGQTGTCVVLVTPDGERTMQTDLGQSMFFDESNLNFERLKEARALYLEGYLAMNEALLPSLVKLEQQARLNEKKIILSFADPSVVKFAKDGLLTLLEGGVDMVFCNLEEAQLFTGKKQQKACARALLEYAKTAVITAGSAPCIIAQGEEILEVAPAPTTVLDTNGAGDNFAGAFLYAHLEHYALEDCARLAHEVAGAVVAQFGPRLGHADYATILHKVFGTP